MPEKKKDFVKGSVKDRTLPEPRWPAILAVLAVGGLNAALPEPLSFGPYWLLLAVVAVLNTAVSLYYYFNFVKAMFVAESSEKAPLSLSYGLKIALGVSLALTLIIGVYPTPFINWASSAASSFAGLLK